MPHRWLLLLAAVLAAALAVLGVLQYRWIDEASIAQERRERGAMELAARHFSDDVQREVERTVASFQGAMRDDAELMRRYAEWSSGAPDVRFLRSLYVATGKELWRFDTHENRLVATAWPAELAPVRQFIAAVPAGSPPLGPNRRPLIEEVPALVLPMRPTPPRPRRPPEEQERFEERPRPDRPPPDFGPPDFGDPDRERPPRREPPPRRPAPEPPPEAQPPTFAIAVINRNYLTNGLFPELTLRDFPANECDVAVVEGDEVVYRSNPAWPRSASDPAEAAAPLLSNGRPGPPEKPPTTRWRVIVRQRGDSVANSVAASRRRNLGLAFAILTLLAASFVLVAVLARRADRLRRQQLEFVAGITHELNTPLAALSSAGQNLADGIVAEPAQVARYGTMVVKESRRLSDMVGQVLDFAGMQARSAPRRIEPIEVAPLIEEAVSQCRWLAEDAGVKIETRVAGDLPRIDGDPAALGRAVQNLVANAIRHGASGEWVGVRAEREGSNVAITVEDHGPGIPARDLPHLFEPFYRGREAGRTRGTGLGLTIVHQVAVAHGGSVEVAKRRQRGAAFTLRIPVGQHG